MKACLRTSELYPIYKEDSSPNKYSKYVDVPEDMWNQYLSAQAAFEDILDDMDDLVLSQHNNGI